MLVVFLLANCSISKIQSKEISPIELNELLKSKKDIIILDIREPLDYAVGEIEGSKKIPLSEITSRYKEISPKKEIIVFCKSGFKSRYVANFLENKGYKKVKNLSGGVIAWENYKKVLKVEPPKEYASSFTAQIGNGVPSFVLKSIDGKSVDLSSYISKKVIVLFFWVPSAEKSVKELEKLQKIYNDFQKEQVVFFSITRGKEDEISLIRTVLKERNIKIPTLLDPSFEAAKTFRMSSIPEIFLIDQVGILRVAGVQEVDSALREYEGKSFKELLIMARNGEKLPVYKEVYPVEDLIGNKPPDICTEDIKGNKQCLEKIIKKKNIILVFWDITCPHCKKELPLLAKYYKENKTNKNLEMFGITRLPHEDFKTQFNDFIKENEIDFPIIFDKDGQFSKAYKITAIPVFIIVDKSGLIKFVKVGYDENTSLTINKYLK